MYLVAVPDCGPWEVAATATLPGGALARVTTEALPLLPQAFFWGAADQTAAEREAAAGGHGDGLGVGTDDTIMEVLGGADHVVVCCT
mmetsp:Transcript_26327/g.61235  ORF Transcript_26327/g.61235 Transcript_26327/m.61235 type:complete len:87 (-) Transcript_26327:298-558(-)